MKRAELIIGQSYYMHESANWRDRASASTSYVETAKYQNRRKVTIVETQLKTDYDRTYRNRDVLIQNSEGTQKWVALNHIRVEYIKAIQFITDDYRIRRSYDDRGLKYQRHLARKIQREQREPAIKALCQEIERVTGEHVYSGDTLGGLELKTLQILNQALSVIKTELTAVAS